MIQTFFAGGIVGHMIEVLQASGHVLLFSHPLVESLMFIGTPCCPQLESDNPRIGSNTGALRPVFGCGPP